MISYISESIVILVSHTAPLEIKLGGVHSQVRHKKYKLKEIILGYLRPLHFLGCSKPWKQGVQTLARSSPCADSVRRIPPEVHCWCNTRQEWRQSHQTTGQCQPYANHTNLSMIFW